MGKTCGVTGHRTRDLYTRQQIERGDRDLMKRRMMESIEFMIQKKDVDTFISGGALETDQIFFVIVQFLKETKYPHIKNNLAIPYAEQPKAWIEQIKFLKKKIQEAETAYEKEELSFQLKEMTEAVNRYRKMLQVADNVVYVDTEEGYVPRGMKEDQVGKHSNQKLQIRNVYMLDHQDYLIAVYNGKESGGTYNCLKSAWKKKKEVYYLTPSRGFEMTKHEYEN